MKTPTEILDSIAKRVAFLSLGNFFISLGLARFIMDGGLEHLIGK